MPVGVNKKGPFLTGKDYMTRAQLEIMSHPDFNPHAMRIINAIAGMTSDQIADINLLREAN